MSSWYRDSHIDRDNIAGVVSGSRNLNLDPVGESVGVKVGAMGTAPSPKIGTLIFLPLAKRWLIAGSSGSNIEWLQFDGRYWSAAP